MYYHQECNNRMVLCSNWKGLLFGGSRDTPKGLVHLETYKCNNGRETASIWEGDLITQLGSAILQGY